MRRYTLASLAGGMVSVALAAASQAAGDLAAVAVTTYMNIAGLPDLIQGNEVAGHKAELPQTIESEFVDDVQEDVAEPWVEIPESVEPAAEPVIDNPSTTDSCETTDNGAHRPSRQVEGWWHDLLRFARLNSAILSDHDAAAVESTWSPANHAPPVPVPRRTTRNLVLRRQHPALRLAEREPWSKAATMAKGQRNERTSAGLLLKQSQITADYAHLKAPSGAGALWAS
ncbi:hypothetical protein ACRALDRAFT_1083518 [Sodiomyces alcalophilus JCM 7366]|uniref:uncharacterized protein n=1 Tax=Sodiomyces alcalophilus JCM 7366 TaxID=591952 RepID=UPI0039B5595E